MIYFIQVQNLSSIAPLYLITPVFIRLQVTYRATSDIQSVSLNRNTSHQMLRIDTDKATFPLLLSFNFAVSTPLSLKGIIVYHLYV